MKKHETTGPRGRSNSRSATWLGALIVITFLIPVKAVAQDEARLSGESTTIFRVTQDMNGREQVPAYEYLHLSAPDIDKEGRVSFEFGGWGRQDLAHRTGDGYHDGDLQYGYLSYRGKNYNQAVTLGRQFITEGIATERIDGLYVRCDLPAGLGLAGFVGTPVVTEVSGSGGDLIYGGRITSTMPAYYTLGMSVVKVNHSGVQLRQEEGADIWFHPFSNVDLVGRSSYNSITGGWMEHDYKVSFSPLHNLSLNGSYSDIDYKAYFLNMTTPVFSLISKASPSGMLNPFQEVQVSSVGGAYSPSTHLVLAADYRNYSYEIGGDANYYGGKATFSLPRDLVLGASGYRMDGANARLRYDEYRVYFSQKIRKFDVSADFIDTNYDRSFNGVSNASVVSGAASYAAGSGLSFWADVSYSHSAFLDHDVRGMFKVMYSFDLPRAGEGRNK